MAITGLESMMYFGGTLHELELQGIQTFDRFQQTES